MTASWEGEPPRPAQSWVPSSSQEQAWSRFADEAPEPALPSGTNSEPVIISHAITVILGALVTAGWVTIPNTTINAIGTVLVLVLSTVGAVIARAKVAPLKGNLWQVIEGFVGDLVAVELEKQAQAPDSTTAPREY